MTPLSVAIITFNEERAIGRCLDSVRRVADEVVVVDSGSADRTVEICRSAGARTLIHPFDGYAAQKNRAIAACSNECILSLDADEALSEELRDSILEVKQGWDHAAYEMNRLTNYCGSWIRHGGWYPDRKVRLFKRSAGRWEGLHLHERFVLGDPAIPVGRLDGDLLHFSFPTPRSHEERIERYTDLSAQEIFESGRPPSPFRQVVSPAAKFVRDYLLRGGFLDGAVGFTVAYRSAYATHLKYVKARRLFDAGRNAHG